MNIIGNIKRYEWGKLGLQSKVADIASKNADNFDVDSNGNYAELWMGDHVSGPSTIKETGESLSEVIANDRSHIGGMENLPFLFKVLSIGKALSLQVHPNKAEAEHLYATRPDLYKDPNHKPELAIALTPFVALCGFRPYADLYTSLKAHPSLEKLIGTENIELLISDGQFALKKCFSVLMHSKQEDINKCISEILNTYNKTGNDDHLSKWFVQLYQDFPNDVGILCIFFLNIIQLQPGQAIFLPAKVPHAYLTGDCIECMACSDNVVRAGLTPKYKDIETLLAMLNYEGATPESQIFEPIIRDQFTQVFIPKIKDFAVAKIQVPPSETEYKLQNSTYGSILIVLSGYATATINNLSTVKLAYGTILFLPATFSDIVLSIKSTNEDFVAYQAMYNDF